MALMQNKSSRDNLYRSDAHRFCVNTALFNKRYLSIHGCFILRKAWNQPPVGIKGWLYISIFNKLNTTEIYNFSNQNNKQVHHPKHFLCPSLSVLYPIPKVRYHYSFFCHCRLSRILYGSHTVCAFSFFPFSPSLDSFTQVPLFCILLL